MSRNPTSKPPASGSLGSVVDADELFGQDPLRTTSTHYDFEAFRPADQPGTVQRSALRTTWTPESPKEDEPPPPMEVAVGTRYKVGTLLGRGGQGKVFSCMHEFLDREVAVKLCSHSDGVQRSRFRSEARLTSSLSHPFITPVYDGGDGFLVMKRLVGDPLDHLIDADGDSGTTGAHRGGPVKRRKADLAFAVEVIILACHAIEYAHAREVLHRDIKAANIITGLYGEVTVIDWGLAVRLEQGHVPQRVEDHPVSVCAGTPACMPPEVFEGRHDRVGKPADVFLLGALLYHALTGRMPYDDGGSLKSTLAKARDVNFPPVERFNAMAPPRLATLQKRAMSRRPHERPTVTEFRTSLQQWIRQSGNVDQARHCVELARLLVHRAQLCSRREHEVKTDCYLQALAQYDRGLVLCEEMPGVVTERAWVLREFIEACVVGGDITLARLLERHNRLPVGRLSPGGVEKPSEGEAALDQITGKTTTTRRARRQPR
ncbi:hypothetical protein LBMAG53_12780 [Planctomycetota bacterium]|nr:hypothetical protein LBMAG53_12780 [Planctomycetota bacterium]